MEVGPSFAVNVAVVDHIRHIPRPGNAFLPEFGCWLLQNKKPSVAPVGEIEGRVCQRLLAAQSVSRR